jgi:hypothetical protein
VPLAHSSRKLPSFSERYVIFAEDTGNVLTAAAVAEAVGLAANGVTDKAPIALPDNPQNLRLVPVKDCVGNFSRQVDYRLQTIKGKSPQGNYYVHEVLLTSDGKTHDNIGSADFPNKFDDRLSLGVGTPPNTTVQNFRISLSDPSKGGVPAVGVLLRELLNNRIVDLTANLIVRQNGQILLNGSSAPFNQNCGTL